MKRQGCSGPYFELCEWIEAHGGKVRLGRTEGCFTLVVDAPPADQAQRVAGYAFADLADLGRHARLVLTWLADHDLYPRQGGKAAERIT